MAVDGLGDDLVSLIEGILTNVDPGLRADWQPRGIDVRRFSIVKSRLLSLWYETVLEFIGFYLTSPNHPKDDSLQWTNALDDLQQMGWGVGVFYVGQQEPDNDTVRKLNGQTRLAHDMTAGVSDGTDAIYQMTFFSTFPKGTTVFLDVESHENPTPGPNFGFLVPRPNPAIPAGIGNPPGLHSAGMVQYVKDWVRTLLNEGNYMPGIYCFAGAAQQLSDALAADPAIAAKLPPAGIRFWVLGDSSEADAAGNPIRISNNQFDNRPDLSPGLNFWFPPAEVWQTLCPGGASCAVTSSSPDTNYQGIVADRNVSTLSDPSAP